MQNGTENLVDSTYKMILTCGHPFFSDGNRKATNSGCLPTVFRHKQLPLQTGQYLPKIADFHNSDSSSNCGNFCKKLRVKSCTVNNFSNKNGQSCWTLFDQFILLNLRSDWPVSLCLFLIGWLSWCLLSDRAVSLSLFLNGRLRWCLLSDFSIYLNLSSDLAIPVFSVSMVLSFNKCSSVHDA